MLYGAFVFPTDYSMRPDHLARALEERGFESLWVTEHTHIPVSRRTPYPGGGELPPEYSHSHDPFIALTAAAAATTKLKVATGICLMIQHDPIVAAKQIASLDMLSGGRFLFGVGGGWNAEEMEDHGTVFKTRWRLLRERILAMKELWTKDEAEFHGEFVNFDKSWSWPKPVQKPHPPIMIGGTGEKVLLKIVAKHADMWNASGGAERMRELIEVIRRHGDAVGRDTNEIEKTVMIPLCYKAAPEREQMVQQLMANMRQVSPDEVRKQIMIGGKQECLDTVERFTKAGVTHFIFMLFQPFFLEEVQAFAEEVIPAAR